MNIKKFEYKKDYERILDFLSECYKTNKIWLVGFQKDLMI